MHVSFYNFQIILIYIVYFRLNLKVTQSTSINDNELHDTILLNYFTNYLLFFLSYLLFFQLAKSSLIKVNVIDFSKFNKGANQVINIYIFFLVYQQINRSDV